jgi:hypothetical protein
MLILRQGGKIMSSNIIKILGDFIRANPEKCVWMSPEEVNAEHCVGCLLQECVEETQRGWNSAKELMTSA